MSSTRYQRQIVLKGFGDEGQKRLFAARILVIGAGGLGCPALQYLAGAGIGRIGILDNDIVSVSNLHRQTLYTTENIGSPKAVTAASRLKQLNPDIMITPYQEKLTNQNALELIADYDVVIDGTDNFVARYIINDACALLNKPLIYGAISQYEGQVAIFNVQDEHGKKSNYRDFFPEAPAENEILNCEEAGVLGVLPGIIGTMQAAEAIKLIAEIGKPLTGRMLIYNILNNEQYKINLPSKTGSDLLPDNEEAFRAMNYEWFCGISKNEVDEIDILTFQEWQKNKEAIFIDVREFGELPESGSLKQLHLPLSHFPYNIPEIENNKIVVFCQTGKRSRIAVKQLQAHFGATKRIYSLKGGISNLIF